MILSKRGISKRVFALVLSFLLLYYVSVVPVFASSQALPSVGWAETVSSFLMSCGIYPYETDADGNYTEWSASALVPLWDEFKDSLRETVGDAVDTLYNIVDITGFLVKGVIAIASGRWSILREFATWLVSKYNVTDNRSGIQLGDLMVVDHVYPVSSSEPSLAWMGANGVLIGDAYYNHLLYASSESNTICIYGKNNNNGWSYAHISAVPFVLYSANQYRTNTPTNLSSNSSVTTYSYGGKIVYCSTSVSAVYNISPDSYFENAYELSTFSDSAVVGLYYGLFGGGGFSGMMVDTTTVSVPAELPEGASYGGLTVAGAGAAVTLDNLTEIIQTAVVEGLKPIVGVVGVNLSPDISLNPDTGVISEKDVTIETVPLVMTDYQVPQLRTVFPFSVPWDIYNVLSALNAEPVRPEFDVGLYLPVVDVTIPFKIAVPGDVAEQVDAFAAMIRSFLLVLMCVGTLILLWKWLGH